MKASVVQVLIHRSLSSTPMDVVYAHEVPILKVIRGSGNVTVEEENCTQYCLKPQELKPRDELMRLLEKYKGFTKEGQNPVRVAFPDGSRDLELFYEDPSNFDDIGEVDGGGMITDDVEPDTTEPDEAETVAPPDAETAADAPAESVIDALALPTQAPQIDLNDRPAVIAELDRLGVPYAKTTATKHLATLLTNSLEPGATE